jgi:hypothetical protein
LQFFLAQNNVVTSNVWQDALHRFYDLWAIQQPADRYGRIKAPSRQQVALWIQQAWSEIPARVIVRCGLLVGASCLKDFAQEVIKEYDLDKLTVDPIIASVVAEGGSEWQALAQDDAAVQRAMETAVAEALSLDLSREGDAARVQELMLHSPCDSNEADKSCVLGVECDEDELMLGDGNGSVHARYLEIVQSMREDEVEKEAEMFRSMLAGSESESSEDEVHLAEGDENVDRFFASVTDEVVCPESASATDTRADTQPESKKRTRQAYSAQQVQVLKQALQLGELTTTQGRKNTAVLVTALPGRDVTAEDVATWMRNATKKKKTSDK